jgi:predicted RecA/RadA family phage recombinase
MQNYVQTEDILTLTAPYAVASGAGALVGSIFGVATQAVANAVVGEFKTKGVFDIAKVSAQAWNAGDKIYWDNSAKNLTTVSTSNTLVGTAASAAANPSSTGRVRLNGAFVSDGAGVANTVTMAAAAGSANVTEVTVTVKDAAGNTVAAVHHMDLYLSDDVDGEGLTGTTASGAVAAKASSGTDLATLVSKKALRVQTKKTGVYVLSITDSAKTAFKVCAFVGGKVVVGLTLATGNYG